MLSALFGSDRRVKILDFFLLYPGRESDFRRLAAVLKLPAVSVRKELESLAAIGLLRRVAEGASVFGVNEDFLLYPELKALLTKAQILHSRNFLSGLQAASQPKLLLLTGFFVGDGAAATDLLLVGTVKRPTFLKLIKELEESLGREINFTILTEKEFRYRRAVMDIFLYNILEGKKIILIDSLSDAARGGLNP